MDEFRLHVPQLDDPIANAADVTPNDSTDLTNTSRALYVGVAGDLTVDLAVSGQSITFKNAEVGYHPLRVTRVYATNTAATDIVAVW